MILKFTAEQTNHIMTLCDCPTCQAIRAQVTAAAGAAGCACSVCRAEGVSGDPSPSPSPSPSPEEFPKDPEPSPTWSARLTYLAEAAEEARDGGRTDVAYRLYQAAEATARHEAALLMRGE